MICALLLLFAAFVILAVVFECAWYYIIAIAGAFFVIRGIWRFLRRHWVW